MSFLFINYGNGLTFDQILDNQQRPESQTVQRSSTAVLSHFYQYDDNHNILTIRDLVEPAKDVTLTYDGLDRLDTASGFWGNGSFSYDLLGNVKSKVLGNQSLTYAYNTKNRLAGVTGNINRSFDYDSRGNVISNGVRAFSFNLGNQLISSGSNSYQYDGYNRRIKKNSNGKIQYTFYDSTGQLLLTDGDNGLTEYFYLGNKLIAKESKVTTSEDSPGYTGHLEDDDLQLTYMQARYYDPVIGRFYSNDPMGYIEQLTKGDGVHGFNRYEYANNNPYKYTDPDGKDASLYPKNKAVADPSDVVQSSPKFEFKLEATIENKMETVEQADNMESTKEAVTNTTLGVSSAALTILAPPTAPYVTAAGIAVAATGGVEPVHKGDVFKTEVSIEATSLTEEPKIEVKTTQEHNHDN
ncbi:RHS repeat-associated core domain-containing protein [Pseudoalteromonas sp. SG41-1]|uniref:RHS repeat domain-containing protein n=1 Tax=Pseudoalteromonas sp. SG41-1 TaxID=2760979 RepID=UPI0016048D6F|nr:RHS repeat-associated core domain-containing protein [Pseudoalteromonas sp. SG41-1]MBB1508169.1 RHS repeat-associated core domain-containing protein [Pseudoalteromonas sp. SG41-1]